MLYLNANAVRCMTKLTNTMAIQCTTIKIITVLQSFMNVTINLRFIVVPSVTALLGWRSSLFKRFKSVSVVQFFLWSWFLTVIQNGNKIAFFNFGDRIQWEQ